MSRACSLLLLFYIVERLPSLNASSVFSAVMMSLRSPLYRISSPFLEHAKRVIAKHRGHPLPPPLDPSSYLPRQLLAALSLPPSSSSFGPVLPAPTPPLLPGGPGLLSIPKGGACGPPEDSSSILVSYTPSLSPDRNSGLSTTASGLFATGAPPSKNSVLDKEEQSLLFLDKSTTPATPVRPKSSSVPSLPSCGVLLAGREGEGEGEGNDERDKLQGTLVQVMALDEVSSGSSSTVCGGGPGSSTLYFDQKRLSASSSSPSPGAVLVASSANSLLPSNSGLYGDTRLDEKYQASSHVSASPGTSVATARQTMGGRQPLRLKVLLLPSKQNPTHPGTRDNSLVALSSGTSLLPSSLSLGVGGGGGGGGLVSSSTAGGLPSSPSALTAVANGSTGGGRGLFFPSESSTSRAMATIAAGEKEEGRGGGEGAWRIPQQQQQHRGGGAWLGEDDSSSARRTHGDGAGGVDSQFSTGVVGYTRKGHTHTEGVAGEGMGEGGRRVDYEGGTRSRGLGVEGGENDDDDACKVAREQQCEDLLAVVQASSSSEASFSAGNDILEVLERLQNEQFAKVLGFLGSLHRAATAIREDDAAGLADGSLSSPSGQQKQADNPDLHGLPGTQSSGDCEREGKKEDEEEKKIKRQGEIRPDEKQSVVCGEGAGLFTIAEFDRVWCPWVRLFFPALFSEDGGEGGGYARGVSRRQRGRGRGEGGEGSFESRKRKLLSETGGGAGLSREAFAHFGTCRDFPQFVCGGMNRLRSIRRRRFRVEVRKGTGCLANSFSFSFSSLSPSFSSSGCSRYTRQNGGSAKSSPVKGEGEEVARRCSTSSFDQERNPEEAQSSSSSPLQKKDVQSEREEPMPGEGRVKEECGGSRRSPTVAGVSSSTGMKTTEERRTSTSTEKKKKAQCTGTPAGGGGSSGGGGEKDF